MKIYNEQIALQSQKQSEVFNLTTQVKAPRSKACFCTAPMTRGASSWAGDMKIIGESSSDPAVLKFNSP